MDYLCRWQVQVSVYCARLIPTHQYLLPTVYLFVADNAKTFMKSNASHPAGPYGWLSQKIVNRQEGSTQFAQQFARPL